MAVAILTEGEPARVEWTWRGYRSDGSHLDADNSATTDRGHAVLAVEYVDLAARTRDDVDDLVRAVLVRREVYDLPGGGTLTTGWQEVP